jgi:hypothetical protein
MNPRLLLLAPFVLMACDSGNGDDPAVDAGPAVNKAECLTRDYSSQVTVDGENLEVVWPVDGLGPVAPGLGNSTELPDLNCLGTAAPVQSEALDTWACVDIFGPGETVAGLDVSIWVDDGSDLDNTEPAVVGAVLGCDDVQADDEIQTAKLRALCNELCEYRGMVHLPGAPGGQPIVARVRVGDMNGDGQVDLSDRLRLPFVDTWVYGVSLARIEATGECAEGCGDDVCMRGACLPANSSLFTAVAITENSYSTIPIVSGVGRIQGDDDLLDGEGNGAVAGSISDCNDANVAGVAVASSGADLRTRAAYFQGDYPSPQKRATEGDATYVFLNHPPGPALIAGFVHNEICDQAHQEDCQCGGLEEAALVSERSGERSTLKLVGGHRVRVYSDSVTILSLRYGLMP